MPRTPPKAHHLAEWDDGAIGVVRCTEGDADTFQRLANELIAKRYPECVLRPGAPSWAWWRVDPVHPDWGWDFAWTLRQVDGPGRGRWQGALIYIDPKAASDA
jgi:hypothetical protein